MHVPDTTVLIILYLTEIQSMVPFLPPRTLESLELFSSTVDIPENPTSNFVTFTRDNYAMLVKRPDSATLFDGETFSAVPGTTDNATISTDSDGFVIMSNPALNSTISVKVPPSLLDNNTNSEDCLPSDRIFYIVFVKTTLFLTPETNCDQYTIGSIVVTVEVNGCHNLSSEVELDFEELDKVSGPCILYS